MTAPLAEIRRREYQSADVATPASGRHADRPNLLWRPWHVCPDDDSEYYWERFVTGVRELRPESEKWPRSRVKAFREALMAGVSESRRYLSIVSQLQKPLKAPIIQERSKMQEWGWTGETLGRRTAYFDLVEALDFFEEV